MVLEHRTSGKSSTAASATRGMPDANGTRRVPKLKRAAGNARAADGVDSPCRLATDHPAAARSVGCRACRAPPSCRASSRAPPLLVDAAHRVRRRGGGDTRAPTQHRSLTLACRGSPICTRPHSTASATVTSCSGSRGNSKSHSSAICTDPLLTASRLTAAGNARAGGDLLPGLASAGGRRQRRQRQR